MSDFSAYDTTNSPSGPEKPRVFGLKVLNDLDLLRRNGLGDTVTKVAGYLQAYEASGRIHFRVIRNDGPLTVKEALAGEYLLREDLDCAKFALILPKFKAVATGALLAVAANNEGVMEWDSTRKLPTFGADVAGKRRYGDLYDIDGASYRRSTVQFAADATNPPTSVTYQGMPAFQFTDANDKLHLISKPIPEKFTAAHNGFIEILCKLDAAEANGDSIDFQIDYECRQIGAEVFGGTTTNADDDGTVFAGGNGAINTIHRVLIPLVFNDATNPLASDKIIRAALTRDGLATVGNVTVFAINLLVPSFGSVDHE
jgi:hypothetical protein